MKGLSVALGLGALGVGGGAYYAYRQAFYARGSKKNIKEYFEKNGIEDAEAYFKTYMDQYNKDAVAYKKIGLLKVREEEFPKNTLRKIMRFKLDTTIE